MEVVLKDGKLTDYTHGVAADDDSSDETPLFIAPPTGAGAGSRASDSYWDGT